MAFYVLLLTCVCLVASIAVEGGMNMTSRLTPYRVRFGENGRLRMEDFEKKTPCGQEFTTAFNEAPQSPCATYQTSSVELVNLDDISFPVRLDFTLNNPVSTSIEMRFMKGLIEVFTVEFERNVGLEIEDLHALLDVKFNEFQRFWMTAENGGVKVGLYGNDEPLIQYIDPSFTTNEVDGVELYSKTKTPTEWKFYEPCFKY
ncbi:uncharacterized protein [Asterias amurensis]|uniref:uncharacterized protein n=1 Tax=Asterias amurensis TaxID=7602 RepID=UPI003AB370AA